MGTVGYTSTVEISTDGGSTHNAIGQLRNWTYTINGEEVDVTSIDSAGWREREYGPRDASVSADGIYVNDDTGQDAIRDAVDNGDKVDLRFRPEGSGSGNDEFTQTFIVTQWEVDATHDDVIAGNFEFANDGAPTLTNQ